MRRVVVTGLGAITPIGLNVDEFWNGIKESKLGFAEITKFDASEYKAHLAAEVKGFVGKEYMDFKAAKRMELFSQYAVAAAREALEDAGLDMAKEDPYRVGTAIGSGVGSLQAIEREYTKLVEKGPGRVNPIFVPLMISNMACGNVSIQFGLQGKTINDVTACALTALSSVDDPTKCSLPFDKNRSGFVLGEGAGVVVLEELEHAKARGAKIYAEVVGYGCSADAYHITSPLEDGAGAARAMTNAMDDAGVKPEEITYINAHGTGTHHNDLFETRAIKLAFGDHAKDIRINSTKSMIGHLLGAAGAVEFITCVKEIEEGYIHRTVGYETPDEEMDLNYCKDAYEEEVPYALSNSLGFGGHNASILIRRYEA